MSAKPVDLRVERYATFRRALELSNSAGEPLDLTGFDFELQVRNQPDGELLLTLSKTNGRILVDAETGSVVIFLTHEETADLQFHKAKYDLVMTYPNGEKDRVIYGDFIIVPGITQ